MRSTGRGPAPEPSGARPASAPALARRPPVALLAAQIALILAPLAVPLRAGSDDGEPLTGFHREWVWTGLGARFGMGGVTLADLDGDGREEILTAADTDSYPSADRGRWFQVAYDGEFRETWSSLPYEDGLRVVRALPVEGTTEIVAASDDRIYVHDGASKRLLRSFPHSSGPIADLEVADLDGDGDLEVVLCDDQSLRVYDFQTGEETAVLFGFGGTDLALGQTDGDAALEIAVAGNSTGGYLLDGATLTVQWGDVAGFGDAVTLADLDGDGDDEIVAGINDLAALRARDPATGQTLWQNDSVGMVISVVAADITGDGAPEIVIGEAQWGTLRVLEGATGAELWTPGYLDLAVSGIAVGDADRDGHPEVICRVSNSYSVPGFLIAIDADTHEIEASSMDLGAPVLGISAGDLEFDGGLDVAVTTALASNPQNDGGTLLLFDAASHALEYQESLDSEAGNSEQLAGSSVAQLDGDPQLELCYLLHSGFGGWLRCEDGASHLPEWEVTFPSTADPRSLLLADLDGNSQPEFLVGTDEPAVYAFDAGNGWLRWRSPDLPLAGSFEFLRAGGLLEGGGIQVVAGFGSYPSNSLVVLDAETGGVVGGPWAVAATALETADLDGTGRSELLVGDASGNIAVLDPLTGQTGPPLASLGSRIDTLRIADTTRDGLPDLHAIAGRHLVVFDLAQGLVAWTSPYLGQHSGTYDTLWIGNMDSDGAPELAVNIGSGFAIFEAPLFAVFADGFESGDPGAWSLVQP